MDLVGRYGLDSQGGRFGNTDITGRSVGIEIEVPIFQGGAVYHRRKAAAHRVSEASLRAEASRRTAQREASEAFRRIDMSIAQMRASERALSSSIAALDAVQTQYTSGFRTIADVFEAQKNVFAARRNLTDARRHYIVDSLKLKYASGELATADFTDAESLLVEDLASVETASRRLYAALISDPAETSAGAVEAGGGSPAARDRTIPDATTSAPAPAPPDNDRPATPAAGDWQVNASSFQSRPAAQALAQTLSDAGYRVEVSEVAIDDSPWYRVRVTGYTNRSEAERAASALVPILGRESLWVTNN